MSFKLTLLEDKLEMIDSDSNDNKQELSQRKQEVYKLGIELIDEILEGLEGVHKETQNKSDKSIKVSKEEIIAFLKRENNLDRFIKSECELLRIRGWDDKQIKKVSEALKNVKYVNLQEDIIFNLDKLIKNLKFIKNELEIDSKNNNFFYFNWIKNKDLGNLFIGGTLIIVDFWSISMIGDIIASISVDRGLSWSIKAINKFSKSWVKKYGLPNFFHDELPIMKTIGIEEGLDYVIINDILIFKEED